MRTTCPALTRRATLSGVMATRSSPGLVSAGTAMCMEGRFYSANDQMPVLATSIRRGGDALHLSCVTLRVDHEDGVDVAEIEPDRQRHDGRRHTQPPPVETARLVQQLVERAQVRKEGLHDAAPW